jgi:hypothetical protein
MRTTTMSDQTDIVRFMRETDDDRDAREIRRVEHLDFQGIATWNDLQRAHEAKRRIAERSFRDLERKRSPESKNG